MISANKTMEQLNAFVDPLRRKVPISIISK